MQKMFSGDWSAVIFPDVVGAQLPHVWLSSFDECSPFVVPSELSNPNGSYRHSANSVAARELGTTRQAHSRAAVVPGNITFRKTSAIGFTRFSGRIHAFCVFDSETGARAESFPAYGAWRHKHYLAALLTAFFLAHVFCHRAILAFFGSGTTGEVCQRLGRDWIGCELQGEYEPLQRRRTAQLGMPL